MTSYPMSQTSILFINKIKTFIKFEKTKQKKKTIFLPTVMYHEISFYYEYFHSNQTYCLNNHVLCWLMYG